MVTFRIFNDLPFDVHFNHDRGRTCTSLTPETRCKSYDECGQKNFFSVCIFNQRDVSTVKEVCRGLFWISQTDVGGGRSSSGVWFLQRTLGTWMSVLLWSPNHYPDGFLRRGTKDECMGVVFLQNVGFRHLYKTKSFVLRRRPTDRLVSGRGYLQDLCETGYKSKDTKCFSSASLTKEVRLKYLKLL